MRIVVATVGTTGDVTPFAALSEAMRAAGHDVTAVSWELHRQAFERAGARFAAAGPTTSWGDISTTAARAAAAGSPLAQVAMLRDFHLRDAAAHYRTLRELLRGHDLVLLHGIHTLAEAAARDEGLTWASAVFDPVLLPTASAPPAGMPRLGPFNRVAWRMLDGMLRRQDGPLRAALEAAGSPSAAAVTMFRSRSPRLHMVAVSPHIAPPPPDLGASTHFTSAWLRQDTPEPLPAELDAFLAGDAPVVVTFGSMAAPDLGALMAATAEGARSAGRRVALQGDAPVAAADGVLRIGAVDHRALFPRAAAVVHHGGAGTTHAAVAAGVPSIVVPHVGDQPFWAARLAALGVAPKPLTLEATAHEFRGAVETAAAPAMRDAAARLGAQVRGERGVERAIALLERLP
ncbi:MAG TPA: glycosyltransferase [Candidatus Limnocylindria bacterium]|nr:glycosyltransferase [Candidatus Limnocylindria bacterium]